MSRLDKMQILKSHETLQRCNFGNPGPISMKQKLLLSDFDEEKL